MRRTGELSKILDFKSALLCRLIEQGEKGRLWLSGGKRITRRKGRRHAGRRRRRHRMRRVCGRLLKGRLLLIGVVAPTVWPSIAATHRPSATHARRRSHHRGRRPEPLRIRPRELRLLTLRINKGSYPAQNSVEAAPDEDCADVRIHEVACLLQHDEGSSNACSEIPTHLRGLEIDILLMAHLFAPLVA